MKLSKMMLLAVSLMALVSGSAMAAGDAAEGEEKYQACAACHLSLIHISEPTRPY